jgi:hypothetical protein
VSGNMKRLRTAIIGTGFMGRVHLEAVRRIGTVDVAAIAGRRLEAAQSLAKAFGVDRAESDIEGFSTIPPSMPSMSARRISNTLPSPWKRCRQASTCCARSR